MIKGVNKKIIEINNPQSIYFEKAVFYLKPNVSKLPENVANCEIEKYINMIDLKSGFKTNQWKKSSKILLFTGIILAALIALTIIFF